jgi:hypothetical protein
MSAVIADYVTVTCPVGAGLDLRDALADVCLSLDGSQTDPLGVRLGKFGLLRFSDRHGVAIASCSGVMLAALRAASLLDDYCAAVAGNGPYRVTHLDLAKDRECDPPAEVARLYGLLRLAGAGLTRKRIPGIKVSKLFSPGDCGRDTGSVMVGHRHTMETSAIIYDRHHDALCKGKPDPGRLLRYEIRTGIDGMTLRDVIEPAALFYHFAAPDLLPLPDDVAPWTPHGEGFVMERIATEDQVKLARLVDHSTDLERMIDLADRLPGEGLDVLMRLVRHRAKIRRNTRRFAEGASGARSAEGDSPSTLVAPNAPEPDVDR